MATVLFYTGLRLSELAGLDVDDVAVSQRRGRVVVRSGKGDAYREVPLNSACRKALDEWASARADQLAGGEDKGPRTRPALCGCRGPGRERPGRRLGVAPLGLGCPPAAIGPHPSPPC